MANPNMKKYDYMLEQNRNYMNSIALSTINRKITYEELSQISANELLIKIKEIRNFNVPVVLLTKDNSYEYNEEYLKQGFVGHILKPLKKDSFIQSIKEYSSQKQELGN